MIKSNMLGHVLLISVLSFSHTQFSIYIQAAFISFLSYYTIKNAGDIVRQGAVSCVKLVSVISFVFFHPTAEISENVMLPPLKLCTVGFEEV